MKKYVILLRGVNVGGRIVKMSDLRNCLTAAGLSEVKTLLQSGNVVCQSEMKVEELKNHVERALTQAYNYPARAIVLPSEELKVIIDANPFSHAPTECHQYVIFFEDGLEQDFCQEIGVDGDEEIKQGDSVVYWKVPKGQTLKTPVAKLLAKTRFRNFNTSRNINTLIKLVDL